MMWVRASAVLLLSDLYRSGQVARNESQFRSAWAGPSGWWGRGVVSSRENGTFAAVIRNKSKNEVWQ